MHFPPRNNLIIFVRLLLYAEKAVPYNFEFPWKNVTLKIRWKFTTLYSVACMLPIDNEHHDFWVSELQTLI